MKDDKDRYVYLHLDDAGITVHVKLDDEGVVVDAWSHDEVVASTWKTYDEMGVVVKEAPEQEQEDGTIDVNGTPMKDCMGLHHDD